MKKLSLMWLYQVKLKLSNPGCSETRVLISETRIYSARPVIFWHETRYFKNLYPVFCRITWYFINSYLVLRKMTRDLDPGHPCWPGFYRVTPGIVQDDPGFLKWYPRYSKIYLDFRNPHLKYYFRGDSVNFYNQSLIYVQCFLILNILLFKYANL